VQLQMIGRAAYSVRGVEVRHSLRDPFLVPLSDLVEWSTVLIIGEEAAQI